jgi:hypothetical protein
MDLNDFGGVIFGLQALISLVSVGVAAWLILRTRREDAGLAAYRRSLLLEHDERRWTDAVRSAAKEDMAEDNDRRLLLRVLHDLHDDLHEVAHGGEAMFGGAELAQAAAEAWDGRVGLILSRTIRTIDDDYVALRPYLADAGLTGPELRFKALAFLTFRRASRLTVPGVSDGDPDLSQIVERALRSGMLAKMFKAGDVVWESAVAAVATYARVQAGTPPMPKTDSELSKHAVSEFKKMVEGVLERFKPR